MNSWMTSYLWDWVALRSSRSYIEPLLLLASKQKRWIWPFNDFLARTIEKPLEQNPRDSWEDWAGNPLGLTLEMMEQLEGLILHPCIEKSRVRVWEMISRNERRELSSSPWMEMEMLLMLGRDVESFFLFFSFSSFSYSPSPSFLSLVHPCSSYEERGREWGMNGWVRESGLNLLKVILISCWHVGPRGKCDG